MVSRFGWSYHIISKNYRHNASLNVKLLHAEASKYVLCLVSTSVNFPSGAVEHPDVPAARIFDSLPDHTDQNLTVSLCGGVFLVKLDPVPP